MQQNQTSQAGERTHLPSNQRLYVQPSLAGRPAFHFIDTDNRPHWKACGSGRLSLEIEVERNGDLRMINREQGASDRSRKEAWAHVPKLLVPALIKFLQDNNS